MPTKKTAQVSMDDRQVSNSELLALLEEREHVKASASEVNSAYREKDKAVKDTITKLGEKLPFRCGPYLISERKNEPRHVEFDAEGGTSISIKNTEDKDA